MGRREPLGISSGEQLGACVGEFDVGPGFVSPQPSLGDRALYTCPVFVVTAASSQEWQVNQLDGNPLIPVRFDRVGQLKELARSFIRISEGSFSGEFHGLSAPRLCGEHGSRCVGGGDYQTLRRRGTS